MTRAARWTRKEEAHTLAGLDHCIANNLDIHVHLPIILVAGGYTLRTANALRARIGLLCKQYRGARSSLTAADLIARGTPALRLPQEVAEAVAEAVSAAQATMTANPQPQSIGAADHDIIHRHLSPAVPSFEEVPEANASPSSSRKRSRSNHSGLPATAAPVPSRGMKRLKARHTGESMQSQAEINNQRPVEQSKDTDMPDYIEEVHGADEIIERQSGGVNTKGSIIQIQGSTEGSPVPDEQIPPSPPTGGVENKSSLASLRPDYFPETPEGPSVSGAETLTSNSTSGVDYTPAVNAENGPSAASLPTAISPCDCDDRVALLVIQNLDLEKRNNVLAAQMKDVIEENARLQSELAIALQSSGLPSDETRVSPILPSNTYEQGQATGEIGEEDKSLRLTTSLSNPDMARISHEEITVATTTTNLSTVTNVFADSPVSEELLEDTGGNRHQGDTDMSIVQADCEPAQPSARVSNSLAGTMRNSQISSPASGITPARQIQLGDFPVPDTPTSSEWDRSIIAEMTPASQIQLGNLPVPDTPTSSEWDRSIIAEMTPASQIQLGNLPVPKTPTSSEWNRSMTDIPDTPTIPNYLSNDVPETPTSSEWNRSLNMMETPSQIAQTQDTPTTQKDLEHNVPDTPTSSEWDRSILDGEDNL